MDEDDAPFSEIQRTRALVERKTTPPPPQISPDGKFYYDGTTWNPLDGSASKAKHSSLRQGQIGLLVGAAAIALGAFLPWTSGFVSIAGIQGDGALTFGGAVVLALCALARRLPMLGGIVGVLIALGCGFVAINDGGLLPNNQIVGPGPGIYLTGLGALVALVAGLTTIKQRNKNPG